MSKMFDSPKKLKFVHTKFPILKERTKQSNFKKKKKELLSCFFLYDFQLEWTKLCIYKVSQFHDLIKEVKQFARESKVTASTVFR